MSSDVLERARERIGGSNLELEQVYRLRDARHTRRRIVAGVTAIMIFVVVFGLLARELGRARKAVPVATPTANVDGWADVTPDSVKTDVDLRAAAAADVGFVAVGDTSGGDATDPVWFSPDGRSWSRVPEADGPRSPNLWDVTAGGPGFVAVGLDDKGNPAAWYSADGMSWTEADVSLPSGIGNVDAMFGVLPTDFGFLARGRVRNGDAYVWTSTDARTWRSVPDETVFGGKGEQFILWMGHGPDGFVAGGYERPFGSAVEGQPAAWTSKDGFTWTRLASVTQSRLDALQASVSLSDHTTATGPLGSVEVQDQMIRFRSTT
jgi:hypothetical protein